MTSHFSRGASLRQKTPPVCRSKSFEGDINTPPNGYRAIVSIQIAPQWTFLNQQIQGEWFLGRTSLSQPFVKQIDEQENPWTLITTAPPEPDVVTPTIISAYSFVAGILVDFRTYSVNWPPQSNPFRWTERRREVYYQSVFVAGYASFSIG